MITLEECRLRGIGLPIDDGAAQDIIDEQEAWLARKIGALEGERSESFYVGLSTTHGRIGLARFTDEVDLADGGTAVDPDHFRLIERGAVLVRTYSSPMRWWVGPYLVATYTPNDELEVRKVLFDLVALSATPAGPFQSETIGSYSYSRAGLGAISPTAAKAALVASLLPRHDQTATLLTGRTIRAADPVINRPEPLEAM